VRKKSWLSDVPCLDRLGCWHIGRHTIPMYTYLYIYLRPSMAWALGRRIRCPPLRASPGSRWAQHSSETSQSKHQRIFVCGIKRSSGLPILFLFFWSRSMALNLYGMTLAPFFYKATFSYPEHLFSLVLLSQRGSHLVTRDARRRGAFGDLFVPCSSWLLAHSRTMSTVCVGR
jgi:hypothetical protein